jgi:hypothetical protein
MSNHLSNDRKVGVADTRQQNDLQQSESSEIEEPKGKHEGKDVSKEEVQQRIPQDHSTSSYAGHKRDVSIIEDTTKEQKINDFIDKMADINIHGEDTSFIKQASAATLLSFSLAAIVCLAVALALTFVWPLVVPLAVAVVLSGILIKYLSNDDTNNQQAAILIVIDFAVNIIEDYPNENYQQALNKLEELAASKEFYKQVKIFRDSLQNVSDHEDIGYKDGELIKQTQAMLTFMFDFIKQGVPEDKKTAFTEIKRKYLKEILNNRGIGEKFLDGMSLKNFNKKKPINVLAILRELEDPKVLQDAFYMGIEAYLHKDQETNLLS